MHTINLTTILNNAHTITEFGTSFIKLRRNQAADAYDLGQMSEFLPHGQLQYRLSKPNPSTADWHVEPDPFGRLIIYLSGKYKITVGTRENSQNKIFQAGDLLFFNDQNGLGHKTEVLEVGITLLYKFTQRVQLDPEHGLMQG